MKRILSMLAAAIACTVAGAQTIDDILGQVGENNLTLKALQQQLDAGADANLAEARLEGPEVEFGYLFGEDGRRRHDFGVSQSFDFGALTGARKRLALGQNELLALEYRASRRDILTQARKLVYRIINCNALIAEYTHRADNARAVEQAYRSGYEKGEFSVIDYRKAAVGLAEAEGTLRLCEVERDGLLAELKNLNGGNGIEITACEQETVLLPGSFGQWLEQASGKSSALEYVRTSTSTSEKQLKLSRSEAFPSLSVGYKSEVVPGEGFRGVSVGVSIPLWSAGKKISSAKKQLEAARLAEQDALVQFRTNAENLYEKAASLAESAAGYALLTDSDEGLRDLQKALDSGQMSLLDYMNEISYFYSSRELALQTQLEYLLAVADLMALEM
ncbi:MAG TPA: TolC family protein [Candidatus Cryptobacteroides pullicola]|nr:TolC family protein [Candidatus Cryptobacteroides pullicola]